MQQMFGPPPPPPDKDATRTLHFNILNVKVPRGGEGVDIEVPADTKILSAEIKGADSMLVGVVEVGLTEAEQATADMQALAYEQAMEMQVEQDAGGDAQANADFLRELEESLESETEDVSSEEAEDE